MPRTHLGVCGPSAAYPGFTAKAASLSAAADARITCVVEEDRTTAVASESRTASVPADPSCG